MNPTLEIDVHEPQWLIDKLRELAPGNGLDTAVGMYEVSDFHVGNKLGVERKHPDDFIGSISSGRLFQQAKELRDSFSIPIILVDGTFQDVLTHRYAISYENVWGTVMSLYVHANVPVFFCGKGNMASAIMGLAKKAVTESVGTYTPIRRGASTKENQLNLLTGLPKVGEKKARALLTRYHTPMGAFQNLDNWATDLDGFGKSVTDQAREVLFNESKEQP